MSGARTVTAEDVARARAAIADVARRTPVLTSATLSGLFGAPVVLKAETLQRTGSFKLRGALNRLASLGDAASAGVVCGSAGNHAQGVALAASARGVPCEVFMPADAPIAKVEAVASWGARVELVGSSVEESLEAALARTAETGRAFIHPFNDPDVIAGQGTLGLELLEDVPDLSTVVVPIGGGGLASGVGVAIKSARPEVRIVGVQAAAVAPFPASLQAGRPVTVGAALTIADGIAVKRPGDLTLPLIREHVDEVVVVDDDQIAEAIILLLERAKLVVEGAGAVGVAAILARLIEPPESGTTAIVLSGGNIDPGLLEAIARRHESQAGRRHVLLTRVPDRPGALVRLLQAVADAGANVVDVSHLREGLDLHVRQTAIQLVVETRSREHADAVVEAVRAAGYDIARRPQGA